MSTDEKSKRKVWSVAETRCFLKCYLARKEEFTHPRKKLKAYEHTLGDMVAQGFTSSKTTTATCLKWKMRTLLSAYKTAKDNDKQTGASTSIFPYMEQMDAIFGNKLVVASEKEEFIYYLSPFDSPQSSETSVAQVPSPHDKPTTSRKRKTPRELYYEAKLELKKTIAEKKLADKKKFRQARLTLAEKYNEEKLRLLEQRYNSYDKS